MDRAIYNCDLTVNKGAGFIRRGLNIGRDARWQRAVIRIERSGFEPLPGHCAWAHFHSPLSALVIFQFSLAFMQNVTSVFLGILRPFL